MENIMSHITFNNLSYKPEFGYRRFFIAGLNLAIQENLDIIKDTQSRKEFFKLQTKNTFMSFLKFNLSLISDKTFNEFTQSVLDDVWINHVKRDPGCFTEPHHFYILAMPSFHSLFRKIDICDTFEYGVFRPYKLETFSRIKSGFILYKREKEQKDDDIVFGRYERSLDGFVDVSTYIGISNCYEFQKLFKKICVFYFEKNKGDLT